MTYGHNGPDPTSSPYWQQPPFPPQQTSKLATWSIVFAFLFAPIGAVLGHFALADIHAYHQRGRDRAVIGLLLSYTVIVIAVGALVIWAVLPNTAATTTTATAPFAPTIGSTPAPTTDTTPAPPRLTQADLPGLLLSLDEVRAIMKTPNLSNLDTSSGSGQGGGGGGGHIDPPECAAVLLAGVDATWNGAGSQGFKASHFSDASTATLVDEVVASFSNATAARAFMTKLSDQWRQCSGKRLTLTSNATNPLMWDIGPVTGAGDRVTLQNTLVGRKAAPQFRLLATKANVVVELGVFARVLTNEGDTIANQILARIPG
jgi:PknH-like extracellular domain